MDVAGTATTAGETFRLVYRSRDRIQDPGRRSELGELFSTARSNNKRQHVSGALLLGDGCFVQTLEGDEPTIRALFSRIEADPRHDCVDLLEARVVPGRVFARWAMARIASDGEPDIPLIAHVDGISRAAPRGDATTDQEGVLAVMRDAARG